MRLRSPLIFDFGAGIYDHLTAQPSWQGHCRQMAAWVSGPRVLDLGIGPGVSGIEMARVTPGTTFVGVDLSAGMLQRAKVAVRASGIPLPLVQADATCLPFASGSFDGATGHSFLYLVGDSDAVLRETHRVLKPGARVAFLEPNGVGGLKRLKAIASSFGEDWRLGASMGLWSAFSAMQGRYTVESLTAQLNRCGFDQAQVEPTLRGLGLWARARKA